MVARSVNEMFRCGTRPWKALSARLSQWPLQVRGVEPRQSLEETEEVMFTSTASNVRPDAGMWCTRARLLETEAVFCLFLQGK
jgi:hypothetical protein